jgi:hypothetical protein
VEESKSGKVTEVQTEEVVERRRERSTLVGYYISEDDDGKCWHRDLAFKKDCLLYGF